MTKWLFVLAALCLTGCEQNLGTPDAPEAFAQDVQDQFDQQIEAVKADPSMSEADKEREIARIQRERESFNSYNDGRR